MSDAPAERAGSPSPTEADEIRDLLEQRRALSDKLARLEESRGAVSSAVYAKVRDDYGARLDAIEARLKPLMQSARLSLESVKQRHAEAQAEYQRLSEELEELRLRNNLGEFEGQEYARLESDKLRSLEDVRRRRDQLAAELQGYQQDLEPARSKGPVTSPVAAYSPAASASAVRDSNTVPAHPLPEAPSDDLPTASGDSGPLAPPAPYVRRRSEPSDLEASGAQAAPEDELPLTQEEPAPKPSAKGQFAPVLIIKNKDNREETYDLQVGPTLVGRAPENDIILLEDESISRRHCRFVVDGTSVTIEDLNSSNGSFVNAERLPGRAPRQLEDNDVIKMGKTLALFRIGSDE